MLKRISVIIALMLCLFAGTAQAATKLPDYALVVNGERVALNASTGVFYRQGSLMLVPVEVILRALNVQYEVDDTKTNVRMSLAGGKEAQMRVGVKAMLVDGKKVPLRIKTGRQQNQVITADVRVLEPLGLTIKHYKPGAALRAAGYPSGVLAIAAPGGSVVPPTVAPEDGGVALPAALASAAAKSDQIVAIRHTSGSRAEMKFYEKTGGKWAVSVAQTAYVGSNGIGKTKEGDKKTPTGTFNLTTPFGIKADPGTKMGGYLKVNKNHYWGGQNGPYYNRLIDVSKVSYTPSSKDEHLIDFGAVYNHCLFIDYNKDGEKDKGSAIFLHCQGKNAYTGGCVALPERVMIKLLSTLNPGAKIVIYK